MNLRRPPDFVLLMPIAGVVNPEGIRRDLGRFIEESFDRFGARFLVYLRQRSLLDISAQLLNEQDGLEGIKIGTVEEDVEKCLGQVPESKKVLWGVGDRATRSCPPRVPRAYLRHYSGLPKGVRWNQQRLSGRRPGGIEAAGASNRGVRIDSFHGRAGLQLLGCRGCSRESRVSRMLTLVTLAPSMRSRQQRS